METKEMIVVQYPELNFDGELHIVATNGKYSTKFEFVHTTKGSAFETLVVAAKAIVREGERRAAQQRRWSHGHAAGDGGTTKI